VKSEVGFELKEEESSRMWDACNCLIQLTKDGCKDISGKSILAWKVHVSLAMARV
jgi:hypothetical protein